VEGIFTDPDDTRTFDGLVSEATILAVESRVEDRASTGPVAIVSARLRRLAERSGRSEAYIADALLCTQREDHYWRDEAGEYRVGRCVEVTAFVEATAEGLDGVSVVDAIMCAVRSFQLASGDVNIAKSLLNRPVYFQHIAAELTALECLKEDVGLARAFRAIDHIARLRGRACTIAANAEKLDPASAEDLYAFAEGELKALGAETVVIR